VYVDYQTPLNANTEVQIEGGEFKISSEELHLR